MEGSNTRILDSVHGYICVPEEYADKIVDTPEFQRLRRIEQTSGRSIYPSAHHDRFIHSLGVYHMGCKIVDNILHKRNEMKLPTDNELFPIIISYELACLLHDIGHSPFSHTFEDYFQKLKLREALEREVNDDDFKSDFESLLLEDFATHEIMSAFISYRKFADFIQSEHSHRDLKDHRKYSGNALLVVRMIVGCKYTQPNHDLENIFIDLVHGTIDADGLDYVCRDAWASGYATANIDIDRLVNGIVIHNLGNNSYELCFNYKVLNELRAILVVKTYQQDSVITHHTVVYEQALLKKAMESAALYHYGKGEIQDEDRRRKALQRLCDFDSMLEPQKTTKYAIPKFRIMDDDFVALMKYLQGKNSYVDEWLSRKYRRKALWKHYEDFYAMLLDAGFTEEGHNIFNKDEKKKLRNNIAKSFNLSIENVWVEDGTATYKLRKLSDIKILVGDKAYGYNDLYKEETNKVRTKLSSFYYIYVPNNADIDAIRQFVIDRFMQGL